MKDKDTHFDCWASPLADILERRKYGLNQKTTILASNVRAGIVDRDKAIQSEDFRCMKPMINIWQSVLPTTLILVSISSFLKTMAMINRGLPKLFSTTTIRKTDVFEPSFIKHIVGRTRLK
jgi:hypothetical protein